MSPGNRTLVRVLLIGLPLLIVGGCVLTALAPGTDDVDLDGSVPVPTSDYDFTDRRCFGVSAIGGGGVIVNTSDQGRRFRIVARAADPSSPDRDDLVEYRTDWLRPGEQEFVVLPPWDWADEVDDPSEFPGFDCTWVVYEP